MSELARLFKEGIDRRYPRGQIVLYQGDATASIFYIRKGYLKVYDIDAKGNEKIMLILGKGNLFPALPTVSASQNFPYFYQTMSSTELKVIPAKDLLARLDQDRAVSKTMLDYYGQLAQDLLARVACIEATDASHKIAQVIQYLITHHGQSRDAYIVISVPLTHQTIADMAGVARETASLHLKEMYDEGIISTTKTGSMRVKLTKLNQMIENISH